MYSFYIPEFLLFLASDKPQNFSMENMIRGKAHNQFSIKALRLETELKIIDSSLKSLYKSIQVSVALCEFLSDKTLILLII